MSNLTNRPTVEPLWRFDESCWQNNRTQTYVYIYIYIINYLLVYIYIPLHSPSILFYPTPYSSASTSFSWSSMPFLNIFSWCSTNQERIWRAACLKSDAFGISKNAQPNRLPFRGALLGDQVASDVVPRSESRCWRWNRELGIWGMFSVVKKQENQRNCNYWFLSFWVFI